MQDNRDEFLTRAAREISDLRRQDEALAAQQAGIERRRRELHESLVALERSVAVYRNVMGLRDAEAQPTRSLFDGVPMGTIGDMAFEVIKRHGEAMKVAEITRALEGLGKLAPSADSPQANYGTVYGTLSKDRRFAKTGVGEFDLAERSPNADNRRRLVRFSDGRLVPLANHASREIPQP